MESGKGYRTIKISKVWTDGVAGIRYQFAIRMRNKLPRWTNYFHKKQTSTFDCMQELFAIIHVLITLKTCTPRGYLQYS